MAQPGTSAAREVRAAAIVAYVGSGFFLLAALLLTGALTLAFSAVVRTYPGIRLRDTGPQFMPALRIVGLSMAILLSIGIAGLVAATGLLRLRPWARDAALAWSLGTTLLFVIILATPQWLFGVRPNPSGILLFMLFLVPVNVWWLMLFTRAEVVALFDRPAANSPRRELPDWLRENLLGKSILIAGVVVIVAFTAARISYRMSPKRDLERTRDALLQIHSWHFHTVRYIQGQPPETIDRDTLCPSFDHRVSTFVDSRGETQVRESIHSFTTYYNHVGDQWLTAPTRSGYSDPGILECQHGPLSGDENSLPLDSVIDDGSVKRGGLRRVNGESCRDYEVSVATPHDPAERIFNFTMCINELDHLPRETRRMETYPDHEGVSDFSQWNVLNEPNLPPEIARE